jgi:hypothetical protein
MLASSDKLGGGCTDREADAHPRNLKRIAMAAKMQHAMTAANANDETALCEDHADLPRFRP